MVTENATRLAHTKESPPREGNLSAPEWMPIRTHRGKERLVAAQLQIMGIGTFIPWCSTLSQKKREKNYLTDFIFAQYSDVPMAWIRSRHGVKRVLSNEEGYARLPDSVVEAIKNELNAGDLIKIVPGQLEDLGWIFKQNLTAEQRILAILEAAEKQKTNLRPLRPA